MKRFFSVLLIILCILGFSSCRNKVGAKAPAWLRGKTWSGDVTVTTMGVSETEHLSFKFDNEGEYIYIYIYEENLLEDVSGITSGNSNEVQISISGDYIKGRVRALIDGTFAFTKVDNNKCQIDGSITATAPGARPTVSLSGTLYGY